ncbi:hypothetical protein K2X33_02550, partial [bacterium]|nr:hypothetical protein [bacterium]
MKTLPLLVVSMLSLSNTGLANRCIPAVTGQGGGSAVPATLAFDGGTTALAPQGSEAFEVFQTAMGFYQAGQFDQSVKTLLRQDAIPLIPSLRIDIHQGDLQEHMQVFGWFEGGGVTGPLYVMGQLGVPLDFYSAEEGVAYVPFFVFRDKEANLPRFDREAALRFFSTGGNWHYPAGTRPLNPENTREMAFIALQAAMMLEQSWRWIQHNATPGRMFYTPATRALVAWLDKEFGTQTSLDVANDFIAELDLTTVFCYIGGRWIRPGMVGDRGIYDHIPANSTITRGEWIDALAGRRV